jgi:outer membrane exchange protein TraA
MKQAVLLSLVCGLAGLSNAALAEPILMNRTEAVSPPRQDPGTGICGSVIKFTHQPTPVGTVDKATALLNRAMGDPNIVGRVSRLFPNINLSIGIGSEADLRAPMFPDDIFPYCNDPASMPMSSDDNNIAARIRGCLNVTDTMNGQPVTLVIHCNDGCAVRLGATRQVVMIADERSPVLTGRRARSVVFQDPGLYPVEITYYQNASSGYLELSRATTMSFASDDTAVSSSEWIQKAGMFTPLGGAELFSAVTGTSSKACDTTVQRCTGRFRLPGGGFVACDVNSGSHQGRGGLGLLAISGLALLGSFLRMRRRDAARDSLRTL